jgi:ferredoxin
VNEKSLRIYFQYPVDIWNVQIKSNSPLGKIGSFGRGREKMSAGLPSATRARAKIPKTVAVDYDLCHSCGVCVAVCPADALFLNDARLEVKDACTGCERCAKVCPMRALAVVERGTP